MSNIKREGSEYLYELTSEQKEALLKIAVLKDEPLEALILQALDEFIKREKRPWAEIS